MLPYHHSFIADNIAYFLLNKLALYIFPLELCALAKSYSMKKIGYEKYLTSTTHNPEMVTVF